MPPKLGWLPCLNVTAIGALSVFSAYLFVQLQIVSTRVASEQRQINQLKA